MVAGGGPMAPTCRNSSAANRAIEVLLSLRRIGVQARGYGYVNRSCPSRSRLVRRGVATRIGRVANGRSTIPAPRQHQLPPDVETGARLGYVHRFAGRPAAQDAIKALMSRASQRMGMSKIGRILRRQIERVGIQRLNRDAKRVARKESNRSGKPDDE